MPAELLNTSPMVLPMLIIYSSTMHDFKPGEMVQSQVAPAEC